MYSNQGGRVRTLCRQNESNFAYHWLALTSIFGLCFMPVGLIKSNCFSLIYSSLWRSQVTKWKKVPLLIQIIWYKSSILIFLIMNSFYVMYSSCAATFGTSASMLQFEGSIKANVFQTHAKSWHILWIFVFILRGFMK